MADSTSPNEPLKTEEFTVGSPEGQAIPLEMIPDIMPVEEAAEHLELPTQHGDKTRHKSGDNAFYFYQGFLCHFLSHFIININVDKCLKKFCKIFLT